jgi:hypothetical protein
MLLADHASEYSRLEDKEHPDRDMLWTIGIFSILSWFIGEIEDDWDVADTDWFEVMRSFFHAAFDGVAPGAMNLRRSAIMRHGVHALEKVIDIFRPKKGRARTKEWEDISSIGRIISKDFYGRFCCFGKRTVEDYRGEDDFRLLIDAFPVLWWGGLDFMFPAFFDQPPASSDFGRAMYKGIKKLSPQKFALFASRNHLVDKILDKTGFFNPYDRELKKMNPPPIALNTHIVRLFRLYAVKDRDPPSEAPFPSLRSRAMTSVGGPATEPFLSQDNLSHRIADGLTDNRSRLICLFSGPESVCFRGVPR